MGWDLWIPYNSEVENQIVLPYYATQVHLLVHAIDVTIPRFGVKVFQENLNNCKSTVDKRIGQQTKHLWKYFLTIDWQIKVAENTFSEDWQVIT